MFDGGRKRRSGLGSLIAVLAGVTLLAACNNDSPTAPTPPPAPMPTTQTFSNLSNVGIPASGTSGEAGPYPSTINVSGMAGSVTDVNVTIVSLSHTYPDDLDVVLVGPQGQAVLLMSDAGGSTDVTNVTLDFDQSAAESLPDSTALSGGMYLPTNFGAGDSMPDPAPAGPYNVTLELFNGTNPNGTWRLYINDDAGADAGSTGGWSLEITTLASEAFATDSATSKW